MQNQQTPKSTTDFVQMLRTKKAEMTAALAAAQQRYAASLEPVVLPETELLAEQANKADAELSERMRKSLQLMADMLARVDKALTILEQGGPSAQFDAIQALSDNNNVTGLLAAKGISLH